LFKVLLKNFWPGIVWGIIVFILSAMPANYFPKVQSFAEWLNPDKIVHLGMYFLLCFFVLRGLEIHHNYQKKDFLLYGMILVALFGGLMELGQCYLFIGRNGNIFDFLANILGCIIAYVLILYIGRKKVIKSKLS
jgi:VanZ family protein